MSVLVFLEHHGTELQKGSLGVLAKAATLGQGDVAAVLVGGGVSALASEAGKFGAGKVYVADDDSLEPPQFFYSMLTRSQRISHENLRTRDKTWLEGAEMWFEEQATGVKPNACS